MMIKLSVYFNFCFIAPTLDIDWQNTNTFASCSPDKAIHVCKVGVEKSVKTFEGHSVSENDLVWSTFNFYIHNSSDLALRSASRFINTSRRAHTQIYVFIESG